MLIQQSLHSMVAIKVSLFLLQVIKQMGIICCLILQNLFLHFYHPNFSAILEANLDAAVKRSDSFCRRELLFRDCLKAQKVERVYFQVAKRLCSISNVKHTSFAIWNTEGLYPSSS